MGASAAAGRVSEGWAASVTALAPAAPSSAIAKSPNPAGASNAPALPRTSHSSLAHRASPVGPTDSSPYSRGVKGLPEGSRFPGRGVALMVGRRHLGDEELFHPEGVDGAPVVERLLVPASDHRDAEGLRPRLAW